MIYKLEEEHFKKDNKPYVIFSCNKCKQYSYVKTTQKTKKCLRCGHQHQVSTLIEIGEIVKGMTNAVNTVKMRQNEIGLKKAGGCIGLKSDVSFNIVAKNKKRIQIPSHKETNELDDYSLEFLEVIEHLSNLYKKFPAFMIDLMAEEKQIPFDEIPFLISHFKQKGILLEFQDKYYMVQIKK